ncbi:hypothetical protein MMPV_006539 [Pyropia vietnamensis]
MAAPIGDGGGFIDGNSGEGGDDGGRDAEGSGGDEMGGTTPSGGAAAVTSANGSDGGGGAATSAGALNAVAADAHDSSGEGGDGDGGGDGNGVTLPPASLSLVFGDCLLRQLAAVIDSFSGCPPRSPALPVDVRHPEDDPPTRRLDWDAVQKDVAADGGWYAGWVGKRGTGGGGGGDSSSDEDGHLIGGGVCRTRVPGVYRGRAMTDGYDDGDGVVATMAPEDDVEEAAWGVVDRGFVSVSSDEDEDEDVGGGGGGGGVWPSRRGVHPWRGDTNKEGSGEGGRPGNANDDSSTDDDSSDHSGEWSGLSDGEGFGF